MMGGVSQLDNCVIKQYLVLYEAACQLSRPLATIFEKAVRMEKLPSEWKKANIFQIHKKGNKQTPSNYQPVSLTSIPCKILESIIRNEIISFIKTNNLLSCKQYGFISGRSTGLQLIKVLDEWTEVIDTGAQINCVFCDFMKAFDKVPHRRLLGKEESYRIVWHKSS